MDTRNKKIIICSDGTWNKSEELGKDEITNVLKFVRALKNRDRQGRPQITYYIEGVGTDDSWWDKVAGGACGLGVSKNILRAYRFLANNYDPGDDIYCFGFSRGAFTARALTGLVGVLGLLPNRLHPQLPFLFDFYHGIPADERDSPKHASKKARVEAILKSLSPDERERGPQQVRLKMLGVWDTVGALGAPTPVLGKMINLLGKWQPKFRIGFHDTSLGAHVDNAYHALAIDEHRHPFLPNLWTGEVREGQDVEQVWFAGAHSDIGGGYDEAGLADVVCEWMMRRAERLGLWFDRDSVNLHPNHTALIHDSFSPPYRWMEKLSPKAMPYAVREVGSMGVNERLHRSVFLRWRETGYEPDNIKNLLAQYVASNDEGTTGRRVERILVSGGEFAKVSVGNLAESLPILDYSSNLETHPAGGVRLGLDGHHYDVGQAVNIESSLFGRQAGEVRWESDGRMGVMFG